MGLLVSNHIFTLLLFTMSYFIEESNITCDGCLDAYSLFRPSSTYTPCGTCEFLRKEAIELASCPNRRYKPPGCPGHGCCGHCLCGDHGCLVRTECPRCFGMGVLENRERCRCDTCISEHFGGDRCDACNAPHGCMYQILTFMPKKSCPRDWAETSCVEGCDGGPSCPLRGELSKFHFARGDPLAKVDTFCSQYGRIGRLVNEWNEMLPKVHHVLESDEFREVYDFEIDWVLVMKRVSEL